MIRKETVLSVPQYDSFMYWFKIEHDVVYVYSKTDCILIAERSEDGSTLTAISEPLDEIHMREILFNWDMYRQRFEYKVHEDVSIGNKSMDDLIDLYESLLIGSTMIIDEASGRNPDKSVDMLFKCLDWLRTTDFYKCPASTKYHDSSTCGLLVHTLRVVSRCKDLAKSPLFEYGVKIASAVRACLLHDWCKIGLYEPYLKNVKSSYTGEWEQECSYKYREERSVCMGHGTSSMFMANRFLRLSYDEALAIRWHMGRWNVCESEIVELRQANLNYPLVLLVQFADQLSIVNYLP